MNIEDYHWICGNCHEKVDAIRQIAECFHPKNGELCFGRMEEENMIYHVIRCPSCGREWEMHISEAKTIEMNRGN